MLGPIEDSLGIVVIVRRAVAFVKVCELSTVRLLKRQKGQSLERSDGPPDPVVGESQRGRSPLCLGVRGLCPRSSSGPGDACGEAPGHSGAAPECHFPLGNTPPTGYDQPTMPRGGRRPGAGAPKGNLNALKTGRRSKQLLALTEALLNSSVRGILLRVHRQGLRGDRTLQDASNEMARRLQRRSIKQKRPK